MTNNSTHVPIEQRWLGLDKRAFPYAIVMVGVIALMAYIVPAINSAIDWTDQTQPGDVIDLGDGLTITPPVGWLLEDGIRTTGNPVVPVDPTNASAVLANDGVTIAVTASGWEGTTNELLDQYNTLRDRSNSEENKLFRVTGPRSSVTTASGVVGVSETFTSATGDGKAYAFALDVGGRPIGVIITVDASADSLATVGDAIEATVSSLAVSDPAP